LSQVDSPFALIELDTSKPCNKWLTVFLAKCPWRRTDYLESEIFPIAPPDFFTGGIFGEVIVKARGSQSKNTVELVFKSRTRRNL